MTSPGPKTTFLPDFFSVLTAASIRRIPYFKRDGKPVHTTTDGSDWPPEKWALAMLGEFGEAANAMKKVWRGDGSREHVASELADGICYLVLLAYHANIDLTEAVVEKWNKISEEHVVPERLARCASA